MGKKFDLGAMSTDEMWQLHVEIGRLLSVRLASEKRELEKRLARLRREKELPQSETAEGLSRDGARERRNYPRVLPKYQNPNEPSETWSGRGKQPRWLTAALKTGRTIEDFVISNVGLRRNKSGQRLAKET
jgi:DNA-binding protein H-NS